MHGCRWAEMTWRTGAFLHWPVDPASVAATLPDRLTPRTYTGDAYVGVIPFVLTDVRPRGSPFGVSLPQLNLRTYVDGPKGPAVYFYTLDVDDPFGVHVARRVFGIPYYRAAMDVRRESVEKIGGEPVTDASEETARIRFTSHRIHRGVSPAHFDASYRPVGGAFEAEPGSLEAFLTENYRFYVSGRRLYWGEIEHDPWPLRDADVTVRANTLFESVEVDRPDAAPIAHCSDPVDMTAGRIRRV